MIIDNFKIHNFFDNTLDKLNLTKDKCWYFLHIWTLCRWFFLFVDQFFKRRENTMLKNLFELNTIFWVNDEDLLEKGLEESQFIVWNGLVAFDRRWRGKLFYEVVFGRAADLNIVKQVHALEWVIPEEHVEKNHS